MADFDTLIRGGTIVDGTLVPPNNWRRVQGADGYRWIMVNGQVTFEDGKATGSLPGKLLRFGQAA